MLELESDKSSEFTATDPIMVETLVVAAARAIHDHSIPDVTTPSEVLSATFTLLDRTLRAISRMQLPEERMHNAKQVELALQAMIIEHGKVPN
jgi:hypothetical protein